MKLNAYEKSFPAFLIFLEKRGSRTLEFSIAEFSATSGIPLVILYEYYGQKFGFTEDILNNIKRIKKFYNSEDLC